MDLDRLLRQHVRLEQEYLKQTLIRSKQLRIAVFYVYGIEKFHEKDMEIQHMLNAIEQTDFMVREKNSDDNLDLYRIFPDGDVVTFGFTPELQLRGLTVNTPLETLLKVNIEVMEKITKKRKTILKKIEKFQQLDGQSEQRPDKQQVPNKTSKEFLKLLDKYSAYQKQDLILHTLIVEKLIKKKEKIEPFHRSLLSTKTELLSKLVYTLTGNKPQPFLKPLEPGSKYRVADTWSLLSMEEWVEDCLAEETVWNSDLDVDLTEKLVDRDIYMKVVKQYTSRGPQYLDLSLKPGQTVKEKYGANSEGMCYGWTRSSRLSSKRYGFYPAESVLPLENQTQKGKSQAPEASTKADEPKKVPSTSSKLLAHFFAKLTNTLTEKVMSTIPTRTRSSRLSLLTKSSSDNSTDDSAYSTGSASNDDQTTDNFDVDLCQFTIEF